MEKLGGKGCGTHQHKQLGGGFKHFFNVHPDSWGNDPIIEEHFFSKGLVQPPTRNIWNPKNGWVLNVVLPCSNRSVLSGSIFIFVG